MFINIPSIVFLIISLSSYVQADSETVNLCFDHLNTMQNIENNDLQHQTDNIIEFPGRGNKFNATDISQLSPQNKYRIVVLKAAIDVLVRPEIVEAVRVIDQPLSYFYDGSISITIPDPLTQIIKSQVFAEQIIDQYHFFYSALRTYNYPEETLVGLSLLFGHVKRPKKTLVTAHTKAVENLNPTQFEVMASQYERSIEMPQNAWAIINFLKNPLVRMQTQLYLTMLAEEMMRDELLKFDKAVARGHKLNYENFVDKTAARIEKQMTLDVAKIEAEYQRNKKFSYDSIVQIQSMLKTISNMLQVHFKDVLKKFQNEGKDLDDLTEMDQLIRAYRLNFIEDFLIHSLGFHTGLNDIVVFLDHINFGSALPMSTEAVEASMLQSIKMWLMPAKAELNSINQLAQKKLATEKDESVFKDGSLLRSDLGYTPVTPAPIAKTHSAPNPNKRRNGAQKQQQTSTPAQTQSNIETIPNDIDLYNFSSFADIQRRLEELSSEVIYQFRFRREGENSKIQTVEFDRKVIKSFLQNPEIADHFIRALNLGFAKSAHQDGLKILTSRKKNYEGRLYELKIRKSKNRLILEHINGHWKVFYYTDKDDFDRTIDEIL